MSRRCMHVCFIMQYLTWLDMTWCMHGRQVQRNWWKTQLAQVSGPRRRGLPLRFPPKAADVEPTGGLPAIIPAVRGKKKQASPYTWPAQTGGRKQLGNEDVLLHLSSFFKLETLPAVFRYTFLHPPPLFSNQIWNLPPSILHFTEWATQATQPMINLQSYPFIHKSTNTTPPPPELEMESTDSDGRWGPYNGPSKWTPHLKKKKKKKKTPLPLGLLGAPIFNGEPLIKGLWWSCEAYFLHIIASQPNLSIPNPNLTWAPQWDIHGGLGAHCAWWKTTELEITTNRLQLL